MKRLVNASEMKQMDTYTIQNLGIPSMVLMERAALAAVEELEKGRFDLTSVLVVCGSGNNGGDGFAIARLLAEKEIQVTIAFVGNDHSLSEETCRQKKICENLGIKFSSNFVECEYTTIVDAIFGIGLSRRITGNYETVIQWINRQNCKKMAVDIPSGIDASTGKVLGIAVKADWTVTFAAYKIGQILYPGAEYCGQLVCRQIGIPDFGKRDKTGQYFIYEKNEMPLLPERFPYSNKGTYGKILLIAGSEGMSGAACLAAKAAYKSGCGLVRVFTVEANRPIIQMYLPEAIVTTWNGTDIPREKLKEALEWADAAAIGPGLGTSKAAGEILKLCLEYERIPMVIDADGLNLLARNRDWWRKLTHRHILTPHIGEMCRLTERNKEEILNDLIKSAEQFAVANRAVCVLKDARTIVSNGRETMINSCGNNGMAVGGAGDVLCGVIVGFLGQGMQPFQAAVSGVRIHGLAGDAAMEELGTRGMLSGDIAEAVAKVLRGR